MMLGCRWILAYLLAYERSFAEADAEFAKAIELDPNEADTFAALSDIAVLAGRVGEGLEHIAKAFRLNPFPASWYYLALGQAQYAAKPVRSRRRDAAQGRDLSDKLTPFPGGKSCPTRLGSTRLAPRPNCSSSPTRIFQPATGRRRNPSATLGRLSISLTATARRGFRGDAGVPRRRLDLDGAGPRS